MLRERVRRAVRRRRTPVTAVVAVGPRQQRHLGACLASLAAQTHPPAALVLAPWGDVDAATLPGGEPVVRATVLPVAATANDARNAGTAAASTPAVLHLDATDTLRPEAVAVLGEHLVAGVDVVAGQGHRLAERLWRRPAVPRFDPAHGRFPWAALPAGPVIDRRVSGGEPVWATPFGTVPPVSSELASFAERAGGQPALALAGRPGRRRDPGLPRRPRARAGGRRHPVRGSGRCRARRARRRPRARRTVRDAGPAVAAGHRTGQGR